MQRSGIVKLFLIFLSILFLSILFTYRLTDVPPGINGDEGSLGYNAASIAKTGKDSEGRFLPLFSKSRDSMDWKQPITLYSTVLVFKLIGISYFSLRFTSFLIIIVAAFSIFYLIRELMGEKKAFFGLLIFLTTPIIMIQSHLALENIAPISFVSLWLLMLAKYIKRNDQNLLFLAGIFLGIGLFSYLGMRLIVPVLVFISVVFILHLNSRGKKISISPILWFLFGVLPFFILLFLSKFYYPGAILGLYRGYEIENYQSLTLPFLSSFDPSFLYITGDATPYHSTGKHGMMLLATLPLFVLGLIAIIRKKNPIFLFIVISFFITPLLFGIGSTIHRASRLLALLPAYTIICVAGFELITGLKASFFRKALLVLVFLLIFLNFSDFLYDYWFKYPQRVKAVFAKPAHETFKRLKAVSDQYNLKPFIQYGIYGTGGSNEYVFLENIYFKDGLNLWNRGEKLPEKSVILIDFPNIPPDNPPDVNIDRIKDLDYYLLINK